MSLTEGGGVNARAVAAPMRRELANTTGFTCETSGGRRFLTRGFLPEQTIFAVASFCATRACEHGRFYLHEFNER